jgi:hypothetical protein
MAAAFGNRFTHTRFEAEKRSVVQPPERKTNRRRIIIKHAVHIHLIYYKSHDEKSKEVGEKEREKNRGVARDKNSHLVR